MKLVKHIVFGTVELFWKGVSKACSIITNEGLYENNFDLASRWIILESRCLRKAISARNRRKGLAL